MAEAEQTFGGRTIEGRVVKAGSDKTRVVVFELRTPHRLYRKGLNRTAKAVAHDERNESGVGDMVRLRECRPISKTKHWRLERIIEKASAEG